MRSVVYDVAVSLDGYIAGPDEDVSAFPGDGDHLGAYLERLAGYATAVMGRRTYEFGYRFGLQPGQRAYSHMDHHVFSRSLVLPADSTVRVVRDDWLGEIDRLRAGPGGDIYLCGGGSFAGWLLAAGRIDRLVLKLAPIVLGSGTPLFGGACGRDAFEPTGSRRHDSGVMLLSYERRSLT